jgi:hypothetical protein
VSLWVRCEETIAWAARDVNVTQEMQHRRLSKEVELEFKLRICLPEDNDEEYEDWYG